MSPMLAERLNNITKSLEDHIRYIESQFPEGKLADESFSSLQSMFINTTAHLAHIKINIAHLRSTVEDNWE